MGFRLFVAIILLFTLPLQMLAEGTIGLNKEMPAQKPPQQPQPQQPQHTQPPQKKKSSRSAKTISSYTERLMEHMRVNARIYSKQYPDYDANLFIKGNVELLRKGAFMKYIPYIKRLDTAVTNYYGEFIGGVSFNNPNVYNHTIYSITSNKKKFLERNIDAIASPTIRLNLYQPYIYGNIYSPLAHRSSKYYRFQLDSLWMRDGETYFKISFKPKFKNNKFVTGHFVGTTRDWTVRELEVDGAMEFVKFKSSIVMGGEESPDKLLPKIIKVNTFTKVLGTHLKGEYSSVLNYKSVRKSLISSNQGGKTNFNLSLQYLTRLDTLSHLAREVVEFRDSVHFAEFPAEAPPAEDTTVIIHKPSAIEQMGRFILKGKSIDIKDVGELKISPLFGPIKVNYSTTHGLTYTHKFKYSLTTHKNRHIQLQPKIGYNFKYGDVYWGVNGKFNYSPLKMGHLFIDIGNGSKIYSDRLENEDARYRSYHARIGNKIELANGLTLGTNIALLQYSQADNSTNQYITFVPEIELIYTPRQYYYIRDGRKVYLYSRYPTFTLNYAKALKNVFNTTTSYNKIEFDMHQQLNLGPLSQLSYRVGTGFFFNSTNLFFTEYNYLKRGNMPAGWDDDIGGAFQLLRSYQYRHIEKYIRANIKFDAPLLLVPTLLRGVKFITKERLYGNVLLANTLSPYIELGYGLGTQLYTVALFWGGEVTKLNKFGVKFTLEVFNK